MEEIINDSRIIKEKAFEEIYDKFFHRIYKFYSYRTNDAEDAKDLTSELFQRVFKYINTFDPDKAKIEIWIFTIARNTLKDYYIAKNKRKIISIDKFVDFFSSEKYVDDDLEKEEESAYLRKAISKLPERERLIIGYKFGAELSNTDIGELMNLTSSNVGVILHRSINKLRKEMEGYYGKEI